LSKDFVWHQRGLTCELANLRFKVHVSG